MLKNYSDYYYAYESLVGDLANTHSRLAPGLKKVSQGPRVDYLHADSIEFVHPDHPHGIFHVEQDYDSPKEKLLFDEIHDLIILILSQMRKMSDMTVGTVPVGIPFKSLATTTILIEGKVLMFSYIRDSVRMLSAYLDSAKDELNICYSGLIESTPENAMRLVVPWMLSDRVSVKLDKPSPLMVLDTGRSRDGSIIAIAKPEHIRPWKLQNLGPQEAEVTSNMYNLTLRQRPAPNRKENIPPLCSKPTRVSKHKKSLLPLLDRRAEALNREENIPPSLSRPTGAPKSKERHLLQYSIQNSMREKHIGRGSQSRSHLVEA